MRRNTRSITAALAAAAALTLFGGAEPARAQGHSHGGHSHGPPAAPSDTSRYTDADVDFMTHMIAHHGQAIEMARLAPEQASTQPVRTLAERIVNAQEDEIATMQQWLRDRGKPVPEPRPTVDHAAGGGEAAHDHGAMPGMLTADQIRQLREARGAEFDRLFLTFMIQHHRGAVTMVERLFGSYGAGQDETVFKFASDVNVDQITEIARMQRMLADLIFEGGL